MVDVVEVDPVAVAEVGLVSYCCFCYLTKPGNGVQTCTNGALRIVGVESLGSDISS